MQRFFLCGVILLLAACGSSDQKAKTKGQPQVALTQSANSDAFNQSFGQLLTDYFSLKDNFIAENDSLIAKSARNLMVSADSLKLSELKADSNLVATAQTYSLGISSEIKGLLGEKELLEKRKSFQIIGDQLYDLIRTVRYDRVLVYHVFCPMAFNDQGASWLSNSPEIINPYIPKKMISCGEIKDSIDFRPKQ